MSALAQVTAQIEGATITGSDVSEVFFTDALLEKANIPVLDFSASNVDKADIVVASAAYNETHEEISRARELNIPVYSYPQFLGRLMAKKRGIAVSGTHGKTTTTAMLGLVLLEMGVDPTIVVGSDVPSIGGNAYSGKGSYFLAEACEYRRHFLNYSPEFLIITNIEFDHPDYFRDIDDVILAFNEMAQKVPQEGKIFIWHEDPHRKDIQAQAPIVTFGLSPEADVRATEINFNNGGSSMLIYHKDRCLGELHLNINGKHNILNALATIAFCLEIGLPASGVLESLSHFSGTKRRFERLGVHGGALIVDDYAHHPTEIRTTLEGARLSYPNRRIRAVFQPHTFSRTEKLLEEFSQSFQAADEILIAEIFSSAREKGSNTISSALLAELIRQQGGNARYMNSFEEIQNYLSETIAPQDLVLTLGAGDIYKVGESLVG